MLLPATVDLYYICLHLDKPCSLPAMQLSLLSQVYNTKFICCVSQQKQQYQLVVALFVQLLPMVYANVNALNIHCQILPIQLHPCLLNVCNVWNHLILMPILIRRLRPHEFDNKFYLSQHLNNSTPLET